MQRFALLAGLLLFALSGVAYGQGQPLTVFVVPSCGTGTSGYTPTQNRLATMDTTGRLCTAGSGGGGGANVPTTIIPSGTIFSATTDFVAYLWASTAAAPKNQALYSCNSGVTGNQIVVKDAIGSAATYSITLSPVSGTIDGSSTYTMNFNYQSASLLCDGVSNWILE